MNRLLPIIILILPLYLKAQDPLLSEGYTNPVVLNPAYSGGSKGPALYLNHSNQLNNFYNTSFLTVDMPVDRLSGGFALTLMNDVSANSIFNHSATALSYGHSFKLSDKLELRPGAGFGFNQKNLDINKLVFDDSTIVLLNTNEITENINYLNFSAGLLLTGEKFNMGITLHNILEPNESFFKDKPSKLPRRLTFHGSYTLTLGKINLSPYLVSHHQGNSSITRIGAYANIKLFSIGASYGLQNNNFGLMAGLNSRYVRFGYSYGKGNNLRTNFTNHEVYLIGTLPQKKERKNLRPSNVPVF